MILTVRGMGEPLCATYARSYLVHKILQVMPYGGWGSAELIKDVHEPLWDTFTVLKQQLASEVRVRVRVRVRVGLGIGLGLGLGLGLAPSRRGRRAARYARTPRDRVAWA